MQRVVLAFVEMLVDEFFDSIGGCKGCLVVGFEIEFDAHDDPDFGGRTLVDFSLTSIHARTRSGKLGGDCTLQRDKRCRVVVPVDPQRGRGDDRERDHQSDYCRAGDGAGSIAWEMSRWVWAHGGMFHAVDISQMNEGGDKASSAELTSGGDVFHVADLNGLVRDCVDVLQDFNEDVIQIRRNTLTDFQRSVNLPS